MPPKPVAPKLPYRPRNPQRYRPNIGLIACGGITRHHLQAYRKAGYSVAALCDVTVARARRHKKEFYPEADVYRDYRTQLAPTSGSMAPDTLTLSTTVPPVS